ncbi:hypothetical protein I2517_002348 [Escherichia coli]|nr:hypothetical protein [Escherichia coli]EGY0349722.1 hypothetical protein [Escherichia coli]EHD1536183.1 hypothetical protein [Escherichia coli]
MRFIPAGAGNSNAHASTRHIKSVYPRWRGELELAIALNELADGLSPLARGTREYMELNRMWLPVYPRWRGELFPVDPAKIAHDGLSPLARGTHAR